MNKIRKIFIMFLVCVISSISFVGCGESKGLEEELDDVGKIFAEAYYSISEVPKFAQDFTYEKFVGGVKEEYTIPEDSMLPISIVTNMTITKVSENSDLEQVVTKRHVVYSNGKEKRQILTDNNQFICVLLYSINEKTFTHEDTDYEQIRRNYDSINSFKAKEISNIGAYDLDFNAFFKLKLNECKQSSFNSTGSYSSDSKDEILTYTIKTDDSVISYTLTYKYGWIESLVIKEAELDNPDNYFLITNTFRYDGENLNLIDINHNEFTRNEN